MPTNFGVTDPSLAFQQRSEQALSAMAQLQPLGRYIDPADVGEAAAFLASDRAHNITGVMLPVDGGYTAR
jgi:NAD(P)-dependent dehydrogenase (short-subunit alcohol dehydrogenase family)